MVPSFLWHNSLINLVHFPVQPTECPVELSCQLSCTIKWMSCRTFLSTFLYNLLFFCRTFPPLFLHNPLTFCIILFSSFLYNQMIFLLNFLVPFSVQPIDFPVKLSCQLSCKTQLFPLIPQWSIHYLIKYFSFDVSSSFNMIYSRKIVDIISCWTVFLYQIFLGNFHCFRALLVSLNSL